MSDISLRPISELDIEAVSAIDEKITGSYKPEEWENRFTYYLRRDPATSLIAECDGNTVGFMLGDVRSGEFGMEDPAGWIEVVGVDPDQRGKAIGRRLLEGLLQSFRERGVRAVRTLVNDDTQKDLAGFFEAASFKTTPVRTLEYTL